MKPIKEWWRTLRRTIRERRFQATVQEAQRTSQRMLQVREWRGELFICFGGTPLLSDSQTAYELVTVLDEMRDTYTHYLCETKP